MEPTFVPSTPSASSATWSTTRASVSDYPTAQERGAIALGVPQRAEVRAEAIAADAEAKLQAWNLALAELRDPSAAPSAPAPKPAISFKDRMAKYAGHAARFSGTNATAPVAAPIATTAAPAPVVAAPAPTPGAVAAEGATTTLSYKDRLASYAQHAATFVATVPEATKMSPLTPSTPREPVRQKPKAVSVSKVAVPVPVPFVEVPLRAPVPSKSPSRVARAGVKPALVLQSAVLPEMGRTKSVPWENPDSSATVALKRRDDAFRVLLLGAILASTAAWAMHAM